LTPRTPYFFAIRSFDVPRKQSKRATTATSTKPS
jgi:hypothetical protein